MCIQTMSRPSRYDEHYKMLPTRMEALKREIIIARAMEEEVAFELKYRG